MNILSAIFLMIKRECLLTWRRPGEWLNPLLFFILVSILFPLAISPDPKILQSIGPGILWVAMLLALLLSLTRLFHSDFEDGSLELWMFSPCPLALLTLAKIIAHWLMSVLPLFIVMPVLAGMYHLGGNVLLTLMITLLLGTPLLVLLGAIGSALTLSLRQNGLLLALILLPLYIPPLIFAGIALQAASEGRTAAAALAWLGVMLILASVLCPWVTSLTLRMGITYK